MDKNWENHFIDQISVFLLVAKHTKFCDMLSLRRKAHRIYHLLFLTTARETIMFSEQKDRPNFNKCRKLARMFIEREKISMLNKQMKRFAFSQDAITVLNHWC